MSTAPHTDRIHATCLVSIDAMTATVENGKYRMGICGDYLTGWAGGDSRLYGLAIPRPEGARYSDGTVILSYSRS